MYEFAKANFLQYYLLIFAFGNLCAIFIKRGRRGIPPPTPSRAARAMRIKNFSRNKFALI